MQVGMCISMLYTRTNVCMSLYLYLYRVCLCGILCGLPLRLMLLTSSGARVPRSGRKALPAGALGTLKLRPSPTSSRPAPHGDFWGADEDAPNPEASGPGADG